MCSGFCVYLSGCIPSRLSKENGDGSCFIYAGAFVFANVCMCFFTEYPLSVLRTHFLRFRPGEELHIVSFFTISARSAEKKRSTAFLRFLGAKRREQLFGPFLRREAPKKAFWTLFSTRTAGKTLGFSSFLWFSLFLRFREITFLYILLFYCPGEKVFLQSCPVRVCALCGVLLPSAARSLLRRSSSSSSNSSSNSSSSSSSGAKAARGRDRHVCPACKCAWARVTDVVCLCSRCGCGRFRERCRGVVVVETRCAGFVAMLALNDWHDLDLEVLFA